MRNVAFTHPLKLLLIGTLLCFLACRSAAQCSNWSVSTQLTASANCAANGAFQVQLSGPDAANLTNIQYAIPLGSSGFSVPLNASPVFSNIPPGLHQVSVVAQCGGTLVGKNGYAAMPGSYTAPLLTASALRHSLQCGAYGIIGTQVSGGRAPFTITLGSVPPGYSGPVQFTSSTSNYNIPNLPSGYYTVQLTDACGSGTVPSSVFIDGLNPASIPLIYQDPSGSDCNLVRFFLPSPSPGTPWTAYYGSPLVAITAQIGGGRSAPSAPQFMGTSVQLPLLPGYTFKDCYGQVITYTIQTPCGNYTVTKPFPAPTVTFGYQRNCNINFYAGISFNGAFCFPVTYTIQQTGSSTTTYGPFTAASPNNNGITLPYGNYILSCQTADGYTGTASLGTTPVNGNPYSVSAYTTGLSLHGYIDGFVFSSQNSISQPPQLELFNGPAGYSWTGYFNNQPLYVRQNQTPVGQGMLKFPAGNYIWKIKDNCGTYYLPVTADTLQIYHYSGIGVAQQQAQCGGLRIWPAGTATQGGQPVNCNFMLLRGDAAYYNPLNGTAFIPAGGSAIISHPGTYTLLATAGSDATLIDSGNYYLPYPNDYTRSYQFTYTGFPVQADMNQSQGFLCQGGLPGQAKIYIRAAGGIPFSNPVRYKYYLAQAGQGLSGPYLDSNSTGVFTAFGGNASAEYDLKMADSCGAFAVQKLKILDLGQVRMISSTKYIACNAGDIQLSAIYLPGATYSWTGPNGFTASVRAPVIVNAGPQHTGIYRVSISTPECSNTLRDSTVLVMAPNPPKPSISLNCLPAPAYVRIDNPQPGYGYEWMLMDAQFNDTGYVSVDSGFVRFAYGPATYYGVAVDTSTGCRSYSDSLYVPEINPFLSRPGIYTSHTALCPGESTTLSARRGLALVPAVHCSWRRNGLLIASNTNSISTNLPGQYELLVQGVVCKNDTSIQITITQLPAAQASILTPPQTICEGSPLTLQAAADPTYTYTWLHNGNTIPAVNGPSVQVTQGGSYSVVVSNGGCAASSASVQITTVPPPVVSLSPGTPQGLCPGGSIAFSTPTGNGYSYVWKHNGVVIPGAITAGYTATQLGVYQVLVHAPVCDSVASVPVTVSPLPTAINLGPDTIVCHSGAFAITLDAGGSFSQYQWSTGASSQQITAAAPGTYWVRVTNACGSFTDTVQIQNLTAWLPSLPDDTFICNPQMQAVLNVPGTWQSISWNTGATGPSISISQPGLYSVSGISPCGLLADSVRVAFCKPQIDALQLSGDTLCEGDCLLPSALISNYPAQYQWFFTGGTPGTSGSSNPGTVCYPAAGVFPLMLVAGNAGGADTVIARVVVMEKPKPPFKDTTLVAPYKSRLVLPACAEALVTDWYYKDSLVCANCASLTIEPRYYYGVYHCVLRNAGCEDSCTYKLRVVDIPNDVWLPDAFTPNGDGRNDLFRIITDNPNILVANLAVYNRWGQRIFISNLNNGGWDGTYHGQAVEAGTYFWTLRYKVLGMGEAIYEKRGDVTLLR